MRTILVVLFVFFYLLFGMVYTFFEWLWVKIKPSGKYRSDLRQLRNVQWAFRVVLFLSGTKAHIQGEDNIPTEEPVLYIGNHRSFYDVILTYTRCPGLTGYISKDSIERVPMLRVFMRRLHCLFIDRDDMKQSLKVILAAIEEVKSGVSICIFPEGTRNKDKDHPDSLLPFKEGSFKIAQKTGCKIVPFAVKGTNTVFEDHLPWIHKQKVELIYGEPFTVKDIPEEYKKTPGAYAEMQVQKLLSQI